MPEEVTDKQVEASRKKVDELREKIYQEQVKSSVAIVDGHNAIRKAALDNEVDRLQAQLDEMRAAKKEAPKILKEQVQSVTNPEPPVVVHPSVGVPEEGAK